MSIRIPVVKHAEPWIGLRLRFAESVNEVTSVGPTTPE